MFVIECLNTAFLENANDLLPGAGVNEFVSGYGDGEGRLKLATCSCWNHIFHYASREGTPHHEIEGFSSTPLGSEKNTSIVVNGKRADLVANVLALDRPSASVRGQRGASVPKFLQSARHKNKTNLSFGMSVALLVLRPVTGILIENTRVAASRLEAS